VTIEAALFQSLMNESGYDLSPAAPVPLVRSQRHQRRADVIDFFITDQRVRHQCCRINFRCRKFNQTNEVAPTHPPDEIFKTLAVAGNRSRCGILDSRQRASSDFPANIS